MAFTEVYIWPRWDVRTTAYKWTVSGSGTAEYYLELAAGGAVPNLTDPPMVEGNALDFTQGTVGSLTASQFDWGDNDTLGFSTLYVRLADDADPDSKSTGFVKAGGNDTGSSATSEATAFETTQYGLDNAARDATNGDRYNIKAGEDEVLTASLVLTTYGTPTTTAPLLFIGYTASAGDGGIGGYDGNATYGLFNSSAYDFVKFKDLHVHNCGSANGITMDNGCHAENVEINNTSGDGFHFELDAQIINCYVHDVGGIAIFVRGDTFVAYNNIEQDGQSFTHAIDNDQPGGTLAFNRIYMDTSASSSTGIRTQSGTLIIGNSMWSNAGTGDGIIDDGTNRFDIVIINNIFEGFSGTGGTGINTSTGTDLSMLGGNIFYNNATDKSLGGVTLFTVATDDTPGSSPYTSAAAGDLSVISGQKAGAFPGLLKGSTDTSFMDQGAIQREETAGGSATQTSYGYFG